MADRQFHAPGAGGALTGSMAAVACFSRVTLSFASFSGIALMCSWQQRAAEDTFSHKSAAERRAEEAAAWEAEKAEAKHAKVGTGFQLSRGPWQGCW